MTTDPIYPVTSDHYPTWLRHLHVEHSDLFPVARSIWAFDREHLRWPSRRELYQRVNNRYENATAMEAALDVLDAAWVMRDQLDCHHRCGVPVFRFKTRNARGPMSVRFGFTPLPDRVATEPGFGISMGGSEGNRPLTGYEADAWAEVVARGMHNDTDFEPDVRIRWMIKGMEMGR